MNKKKISFSVTEKMVEMIEDLKGVHGYPHTTAVIQAAIINMHKSEFPAYKRSTGEGPKTPEDKVREKMSEAEVRERMEDERQEAICGQLGGKVVVDEHTGAKSCVYHTYSGKVRYEQEVSIDQLSEDLPKTQYAPDKETVERLQREGKTNY